MNPKPIECRRYADTHQIADGTLEIARQSLKGIFLLFSNPPGQSVSDQSKEVRKPSPCLPTIRITQCKRIWRIIARQKSTSPRAVMPYFKRQSARFPPRRSSVFMTVGKGEISVCFKNTIARIADGCSLHESIANTNELFFSYQST